MSKYVQAGSHLPATMLLSHLSQNCLKLSHYMCTSTINYKIQ